MDFPHPSDVHVNTIFSGCILLMSKENLVFYKNKIYLIFLYKYWLSHRLSIHLYDQVQFGSQDQFDPSKGSSKTWSDNSGQKSIFFMSASCPIKWRFAGG